jgi:hypothetical protein
MANAVNPMLSTDFDLVAQWANAYAALIDPNILTRIPVDAPIADRLKKWRKQDNGLAAIFVTLAALNLSDGADGTFSEGGCPPDLSPDKEQCVVLKHSLGFKAGLTDVALTATIGRPQGLQATQLDGVKFANLKAEQVELLYVAARGAEEWQIIRGNNTGNQWNGLETDVTCCCDLSNGSITKPFLDMQFMLMLAVGVRPTAIYAHPVIIDAINQAYMTTANYQFNLNQGSDQAVLGVYGNRIVTPAGVIPLISDHRFTIDTIGGGVFAGDIFIVTELYRGQPVLYLEDQIPWSYLDLARTQAFGCTSEQFFVWEHSTLVNRACPDPADVCNNLHKRICNVGVNITCGTVPTPTVVSYY